MCFESDSTQRSNEFNAMILIREVKTQVHEGKRTEIR